MTLIEVMIALVVTTVGLLGALAMIGSLYSGSSFNRNLTEAMTLAQSKVEAINSLFSLPAANTTETESLDAYGNTPGSTTPVTYTRTTTWQAMGYSSTLGTRTAIVEVKWQDGAGTWHRIFLNAERVP